MFFIHERDKSFFSQEFAIVRGFYLTEQIDNDGNCRIYFFSSNYKIVYDKLINNPLVAKKFINLFKSHNKEIIEKFNKIRNNFDNQRKKYFKGPNHYECCSEQEELLAIFKNMQVLDENASLTPYEWMIISVYGDGKVHITEYLHRMLDASKEEVEDYIKSIRHKLFNRRAILNKPYTEHQ